MSFEAGTPITVDLAPGRPELLGGLLGRFAIETLRLGALVHTPEGSCRVVATMASEVPALVRVTLEDGRTLTCAPDHPFAVPMATLPKGAWVEACALAPGQVLIAQERRLDIKRQTPAVVAQVAPAGAGVVYTLTVDRAHCYYANGVLVSNREEAGYA